MGFLENVGNVLINDAWDGGSGEFIATPAAMDVFADLDHRWNTLKHWSYRQYYTDKEKTIQYDYPLKNYKQFKDREKAWDDFAAKWKARNPAAVMMIQAAAADTHAAQLEIDALNSNLLGRTKDPAGARMKCIKAAMAEAGAATMYDWQAPGILTRACGLFYRDAGVPKSVNATDASANLTAYENSSLNYDKTILDIKAEAQQMSEEAAKLAAGSGAKAGQMILAEAWKALSFPQKAGVVIVGSALTVGAIGLGLGQIRAYLPVRGR